MVLFPHPRSNRRLSVLESFPRSFILNRVLLIVISVSLIVNDHLFLVLYLVFRILHSLLASQLALFRVRLFIITGVNLNIVVP